MLIRVGAGHIAFVWLRVGGVDCFGWLGLLLRGVGADKLVGLDGLNRWVGCASMAGFGGVLSPGLPLVGEFTRHELSHRSRPSTLSILVLHLLASSPAVLFDSFRFGWLFSLRLLLQPF